MNDLERREFVFALPVAAGALGLGLWLLPHDIKWSELGLGLLVLTPFAYALTFLPVAQGYLTRRRLADSTLRLEDRVLTQILANGATKGRIRIDEPFKLSEIYREAGHAAYKMRQGLAVVEFLSDDPLAEFVVHDLSGKEWPPPAPRSFYGH
jgi:hypothetical protein